MDFRQLFKDTSLNFQHLPWLGVEFENLVCRNEVCFAALLAVSMANGLQIFAEWPA